MAQPKTIFDEVDEAAEDAAIAQANAEIDAGRGIPHEIVAAWLRKLAQGVVEPPPSGDFPPRRLRA